MKWVVFYILLIFTAFSCVFAANETYYNECASVLSEDSSPTKFVHLNAKDPLNFDIKEVEGWINKFKSKMLKDLYSQQGILGSELQKVGFLSAQRRQELAFGVEVRPISKDSNIYLAVFWSENNLNMAQMRTELFAYGGGDSIKGQIPNGTELFLHVSCEACRGLNLNGVAYRNFLAELKLSGNKLFPEELAFYKRIITPLMEVYPDGDFNLISINAKAPALDTIVHEGHHAMFDSDPNYRETLLNYWDKNIRGLAVEKQIEAAFRTGYPTYELLQDEFFAHLFQPPTFGQFNPIEKFQDEHLDAVLKALDLEGLRPPFYPNFK